MKTNLEEFEDLVVAPGRKTKRSGVLGREGREGGGGGGGPGGRKAWGLWPGWGVEGVVGGGVGGSGWRLAACCAVGRGGLSSRGL